MFAANDIDWVAFQLVPALALGGTLAAAAGGTSRAAVLMEAQVVALLQELPVSCLPHVQDATKGVCGCASCVMRSLACRHCQGCECLVNDVTEAQSNGLLSCAGVQQRLHNLKDASCANYQRLNELLGHTGELQVSHGRQDIAVQCPPL